MMGLQSAWKMTTDIKSIIKHFIRSVELKVAQAHLGFGKERHALIVLLFHTVFRDEEEKNRHLVYPSIGMTVQNFQRFFDYFLQHDYCFISPDDILQGLDHRKQYVLITFDDGYYNNTRILPLLTEYRIPSVFFISANHIRDGKSYWWDVVFRACHAKGMPSKEIDSHINRLKLYTNEGIERHLREVYDLQINSPIDDLDRPLTPGELRDFSRENCVYIGNHTSDHAILTNYSLEEAKTQIADAQETIYDMTRFRPIIISYPNGNYTPVILNIAREVGIQIGISAESRKNLLPLDTSEQVLMCLGRFMPHEAEPIDHQCALYRSDLVLSRMKSKLNQVGRYFNR